MGTWRSLVIMAALGCAGLSACAGEVPLPEPRSVIVYSGERLQTTGERMREIQEWLQPQMEAIEQDPSFLIAIEDSDEELYPWQSLEIEEDTATATVHRTAPDAGTPYMIYAHLRLMAERGEMEEWIPGLEEGETLEGYEREKRILEQVSDVWLLGRSVFDTPAYGPMDELLYATERGLLDEFILATQGDRFPEERAELTAERPGWREELQAFFQTTFEREGPGYVAEEDGGSGERGVGA